MGKKKKGKKEPFQPEKDTGEGRPVRAAVAVADTNDKYSQYPSNGLTPRRLAAIFREADAGDIRRQMELFEEMEEKDAHLFAQMQTRKLSVTGLDWKIQPFSEEEQDKRIAEFIQAQLERFENMDEILMDLLDAIGKGISIMEILWDVDKNGFNVIEDILPVHSKKLFWEPIADELKLSTKDYPAGISLPRNKFVIHKYKAKSGHPSRAGVLRIVSWMYLFKNYDLKDWVAFCEVFGMPLRLGKYTQASSEDDKAKLMEAIIQIGSDAAGIIPDSTTIEFIESNKQSSVDIYEQLARYCDEQISKAVLGQTLSSDSGGGSYAQGKVHNEVRHDLTVADAKALAATIRRDIIGPLVEYNFGQEANLPFFQFDTEEPEDQKEASEVLLTLARDLRLPVSAAYVYKKFNIPKPETGEELLPLQSGSTMGTEEERQLKSLKDEKEPEAQEALDRMAELSRQKAGEIFEEMLKPILNIIDKSDNLETLKKELSEKENLKKLLSDMDSREFEDLLQQEIYMATLIGRADI